jgi:hypothetical protein
MPNSDEDEFAEFETDEATFDAMMAEGEPAVLVPPPAHVTTVLSAARDVVTFARGLPVTISVATSAAASEIQQSQIRVQPIRQDRHLERVAS